MFDFDMVDKSVPGGKARLVTASPVTQIDVTRFDVGLEVLVRRESSLALRAKADERRRRIISAVSSPTST